MQTKNVCKQNLQILCLLNYGNIFSLLQYHKIYLEKCKHNENDVGLGAACQALARSYERSAALILAIFLISNSRLVLPVLLEMGVGAEFYLLLLNLVWHLYRPLTYALCGHNHFTPPFWWYDYNIHCRGRSYFVVRTCSWCFPGSKAKMLS